MPERRDPDEAIRRGLDYLAKEQEADGSFISFSSLSMKPFRRRPNKRWQTNFVPALMLGALAELDEPAARRVRSRTARFLLGQRSKNWSFNYWAADAPERLTQPYPDDLDDTFCALAGLFLHDPSSLGPGGLAQAVKLLLAAETKTGGPYRTWLVASDSQPAWLDVDLAVNSNVAYFLSLIGTRLPALDALMARAIDNDDFSSPYYPSPYALVYYLARALGKDSTGGGGEQGSSSRLLGKVRRMQRSAATDLDRALCLSSRLRLGDTRDLRSTARALIGRQRSDGSWPAATFYADPAEAGDIRYSGGPALTTAFVIEALRLERQSSRRPAASAKEAAAPDTLHRHLRTEILLTAKHECRTLGKDLRPIIAKALKNISGSASGPEIIGLAYDFNRSLKEPPLESSDKILLRLGLANLYGWTAYTIYDDFLDGEGKPPMLPAANVSMRKSLDCFLIARPTDEPFQAVVRTIFDDIDSANAWEQTHCYFKLERGRLSVRRLPEYGDLSNLADKSLGHALPSLAVLAAAGFGPADKKFEQILDGFRHYLVAKQLNDDAHDWESDLRNGQITWVVGQLLKNLGAEPGQRDLENLLERGRRHFWNHILPETCGLMLDHTKLGRQYFEKSGLIKSGSPVFAMLDRLETSVDHTLKRQHESKNFLKHYMSPHTPLGAINL